MVFGGPLNTTKALSVLGHSFGLAPTQKKLIGLYQVFLVASAPRTSSSTTFPCALQAPLHRVARSVPLATPKCMTNPFPKPSLNGGFDRLLTGCYP